MVAGETRSRGLRALSIAVAVLWAALLVTIPFTSHPWTASLVRWGTVSPLAALPLIGLTLLWLPIHFLRVRSIPKLSIPLLIFVLLAVMGSLLAFFLPLYPAFGQTVPGRELRSLLTLGAGVAFYLVASTWPDSENRLQFSLRWLYVGAGLLLIYSTFQILTLPSADHPVPESLIRLHRLFTVRDPFRARVTGFAYEPSWLGNQLVILYIPIFLGCLITGYSAFARKGRWASIELVLLLWSLVVLFFTFARLAWISMALLALVLLIVGSSRVSEALARRFGRGSLKRSPSRLTSAVAGSVALAVLLGALVVVASLLDERIAGLFEVNLTGSFSGRHPWPYQLANELKYAERLMYWVSGLRVFSMYPVLGVGLGNVGFLMASTVPAYGYYLPEIIRTIHLGRFGFPNAKSLWVRLLAETGIVGFAVFVSWLIVLAVAAARVVRNSKGVLRAVGLAALFALLAQITEGFSMDTFGLPHFWIILGLLTAAHSVRSKMIDSGPPVPTANSPS